MKRNLLLLTLLVALFMPWAANAQTLWSEGFEGGSMPTGWTTDGPGTWRVGSGDYSSSTGAGMGTYNALITHGNSDDVTKLITPEIDLSSVTSAVLSFMHVQRSWAGDIDELRVYYRTSSSDAWTQLVAYTSAVASWTTEEDIILPNTSATYQLAFEHTDKYGYGVGLDQVVITPPVTCPKPTELTCTAYTTTTATLAWTENGEATSWVLEYGTADDFTGTTSVNVSGTPSKELTGLTAETTYYARVKADCGGGDQSDWSNTCEFRPSAAQIVQIGEGESASTYLPAYTFYNNNLTEQLYTAEEVGMAGDIVSLAFYNAGSTKTPNIKIYLVNTDKEAFESTTDWLTVTADDLVFEGDVTFTAGEWTTIHFDNSFYYDGNSNLGLVVDEAMTYSSGLSCRVFTSTDNCSLYHYDDNVDFDATNPSSGYTSSRLSVKNQIQLGIIPGEAPSCPKPTGLALTASGNTITATWNGTADTYNIDINGTVTNNVTSLYTFTGEYGTTYTVKVQANCGGETSDWSNAQSVTTDLCPAENMCALTFELTDSYGDGWDDSYISVVDAATGLELAQMSADDHGGGNVSSTDTKTLAVCDGRAINFVWVSGSSYDSEASYVVMDANDEIILSGAAGGGMITNYTVNCAPPACPKPKELAVEADVTSANISWVSESENFELWWREAPEPCGFEDGTLNGWTFIDADGDGFDWVLHAPDPVYVSDLGHNGSQYYILSQSYDFDAGALTPDNYFVSPQITLGGSISFWACAQDPNYPAEHFGVAVSTTSNTDAGAFTTIQEWTMMAKGSREITGNRLTRSRSNRAGTWYYYTVDLSAYSGQGYVAIRHFNCSDQFYLNIDDITIVEPGQNPWNEVNPATNPYTLTGLTPSTNYEVQVRALCGEDGESDWVHTTFETLSNCGVPAELEATDVMPTSATLNWTGVQDSYTVRYRTAAHSEAAPGAFNEDFESASLETNGWTVLREGEGTEYTDWRIFTPASFEDESVTAHSGDYVVMGRSWSNEAYSVDNWLISPQVTLDGELSYWVLDDGQYHEHYDVYVSTTTTETSAFTLVYEPGDASSEWTQHTVDLSSYAGQQGYIAFRLVDEDQDFLFLDDITIGSVVEVPAGEWKEVEVSVLPYTLENLEDNTEYEWQVQGINPDCDGGVTEWSEVATFHTPSACEGLTSLSVDTITATSIQLSWTGYQESYLVQYRTAEIITDTTFVDTADEQGNWTVDNLEEQSGWETIEGYFTFIFTENPPQTLISPELTIANNSALSFEYVVYDAGYPESFKVGFSTTDNDVDSFTWGEEMTVNNTSFNTYCVAIPDGAKYFAIQCTSYDAYALILDNFVIGTYVPAGEWQYETVNGNTVTIDGLTPDTKYDLLLQGICGDDEYTEAVGGYFWTDVQTNITQTIALTNGVNWISFYVETNLDDLKAALVNALPGTSIAIKSRTQTTTYNGARWRGALNTLDVAQMYMVEVQSDCEITLEGMLINPAELTINIQNGANYIAFPFNTSMTPTTAFAGFAIANDMLSSRDQSTTYNGTRWRGALSTLAPGQGYIYKSTSNDVKPFVYPTASKVFRHSFNTLSDSNHNMPVMKKSVKKSTTSQQIKAIKKSK